jgi:hypothetical protein
VSKAAVYLRDLASATPDSVPPPPPVEQEFEPRTLLASEPKRTGRPWTGSLEWRNGTWYARFIINGKRRRYSLKTKDETIAQKRRETLAADLREHAVPRKKWQPQKPGKPVGDDGVFTRITHPGECASWKLSKRRCTSPKDQMWPYYGGRGIQFHPAWAGEDGFQIFMRDMGPKPSPAHILGRKNKNGHVAPGNAKWMLRADVRVGVRKNYDTGTTTTRCMPLMTWASRSVNQVRMSEHNNLIRVEGIEEGITPNEADELARHLICLADVMRRRRSVPDAAR